MFNFISRKLADIILSLAVIGLLAVTYYVVITS